MSDPNASEELRSKAIDASVKCYKLQTSVVFVALAIIGTAAIAISSLLFERNGKNEKK